CPGAPRAARVDCVELGHLGQQSQGQVLHPHSRGAPPARRRYALLGAANRHDGSHVRHGQRHGDGSSMSRVRRGLNRLRAFATKPPLDADLEAELAAHIELAIQDNMARGLSATEARRLALVSLGGLEQARDQHREARGLMKLDILMLDLKYTLRTLGRDPGFTIVAVLILALAIGANVAVFSVVNTLLLRPLPFASAEQLVWIAPPPTKCGISCATYSTDAYDEFRMYSRSYQDVTGYFAFSSADNLSLNRGGAPIPATSIDVIANFFQVLGVQAAM